MIKCITLNPGLGPAGGAYLTPFTDGLVGFTACTPLAGDVLGVSVTPFPGTVESAWYEGEAALLAAHGCASLAALIARDDALRLVARENIVVAGPATRFPQTGVKLMSFLYRAPGWETEAFQAYWRDGHGPLVVPTPRLRRYVQNHLVAEHFADGRKPPCDGVAELWWDTHEDFVASWGSREMQEDQFADAKGFLGGGLYRCLAKEKSLLGAVAILADRES